MKSTKLLRKRHKLLFVLNTDYYFVPYKELMAFLINIFHHWIKVI